MTTPIAIGPTRMTEWCIQMEKVEKQLTRREQEDKILNRIRTMSEVCDGEFISRDVWQNIPELADKSCYDMTPMVNKMLTKARILGIVDRTDRIHYGPYNARYTVWKVL